MNKNKLALLRAGLLAPLVGLSIVAGLLIPAHAGAADSLLSRGCAPTAYNDNLVYNPSFEDVHGSSGGVYTVYPNAGGVNFWTTTNSQTQVVPSPNSYNTALSTPNGWPPYDGYNEAVLMSHAITGGLTAGNQFPPHPGLIGTLAINYPNSTPTVVGTKYVLSARISNVSNNFPASVNGQLVTASPVAVEIRLRSSTTGAESTPVQAIIPNDHYSVGNDGHAWGLISGTVTANQVYDRVVLRHYQDTGYAFVDDVVVCRAPTPSAWWQNHGTQAGLALFSLATAGEIFIWHSRRSKSNKGKSKASHVAVGDVNGDGNPDGIKVSDNDSPRPLDRVLRTGNLPVVGLAVVGVAGAAIFIASTAGGAWKSKIPTPINTPTVTGKSSPLATKTVPNPATAKTCTDKETIKEGYKLFRSDTYKYCIQYPMSWPVNSTDPAKVTFGTVPAGEPGPGWLKVTYFSNKTVAMRVEEIKANFKEPAGPCTETAVTLTGESGKKLDCIGAANGEHHIFYVVSDGSGNLFELSYIEDLPAGAAGTSTSYNSQYKVMVDSYLSDVFANKQ